MALETKIEWCDATINFGWGCEKISAGCANCYAEKQARRIGNDIWGKGKPRRWIKSAVDDAYKLNQRAQKEGVRLKVFTSSMADFFEEDNGQPIVDHKGNRLFKQAGSPEYEFLPENIARGSSDTPLTLTDLRRQAFEVIDNTPHLDWLIVTKRPENIRKMWPSIPTTIGGVNVNTIVGDDPDYRRNVWLLTSVENQEAANMRIPQLLKCRDLVPVLGLSCEPLLGPVNLDRIPPINRKAPCTTNALSGATHWPDNDTDNGPKIDWVIAGGESGHNARPVYPDWVCSIRDQCQAANVPFFFKQWGEWMPYCRDDASVLVNPFGEYVDRHSLPNLAEHNYVDGWWWPSIDDATVFQKVGKKAAGRLLDGVESSEFPEVAR